MPLLLGRSEPQPTICHAGLLRAAATSVEWLSALRGTIIMCMGVNLSLAFLAIAQTRYVDGAQAIISLLLCGCGVVVLGSTIEVMKEKRE